MKKPRSAKAKPVALNESPLAVLAQQTSLSTLRNQTGLLSRAWAWLRSRRSAGADNRRLRVAETVSLGEKRFVAVVQVAGRDFLVAGGPSNIALLAQLNPNEPFEDVLRRTMTVPKRKRAVKRKAKPKAANPAVEQDAAQSHKPASVHHVLQKSIKPARKRRDNAPAEQENTPVMPPFDVPESFRYVLQNTVASDANQQNGRSETEHTGHWA